MLAAIQAHLPVALPVVFTVISIALTAAESVLTALGKTTPPGLTKALAIVAKILHFLNGAAPAAQVPAPTPSPAPTSSNGASGAQ